MPQHRYKPLSDDLQIDPGLREAINHNGWAFEEEFAEVRRQLEDISTILQEVGEKVSPVHELFMLCVKTMQRQTEQTARLVDQVIAERAAYGAGVPPLPPPREKLPTYDEIKEAAKRGAEEGIESKTGRHTILTSERARAMTDAEELATYREIKGNVKKIGWKIVGALALAGAMYAAGHLEGRATAPPPSPSTPAANH